MVEKIKQGNISFHVLILLLLTFTFIGCGAFQDTLSGKYVNTNDSGSYLIFNGTNVSIYSNGEKTSEFKYSIVDKILWNSIEIKISDEIRDAIGHIDNDLELVRFTTDRNEVWDEGNKYVKE